MYVKPTLKRKQTEATFKDFLSELKIETSCFVASELK